MEVDQSGNVAKSAVALPSLRQLVTRELTAKQASVAIHHKNLPLPFSSTDSKTSTLSDQEAEEDADILEQSLPSGNKPYDVGSSTTSPCMAGMAVTPSIDHRMEIILDPRSSMEKLTKDNGPVLSFPFFNPTKLKPFDFHLAWPEDSSINSAGTLVGTSYTGQHQLVPVAQHRRNTRMMRRARDSFYQIGSNNSVGERRLIAAIKNDEGCRVSKLLHEGVNPNFTDNKKRTPLHIAASQGQRSQSIIGMLLNSGADPKMKDILGNTPLHLAVCGGDKCIVKLLIESGADIHSMDHCSRSPLSIVKARITSLVQDRNTPTHRLKEEFLAMAELLQSHDQQRQAEAAPIEDLCRQMEAVSTREQAGQIADAMIDKMSSLCIKHQHRQTTVSNAGLHIL